jgi:hypothetical protein
VTVCTNDFADFFGGAQSGLEVSVLSVIHGGMAIGDFDVAPAFERSKHHEEVGGAVALVLLVETGRAPRFHRDRHARLRKRRCQRCRQLTCMVVAPQPPSMDARLAKVEGAIDSLAKVAVPRVSRPQKLSLPGTTGRRRARIVSEEGLCL